MVTGEANLVGRTSIRDGIIEMVEMRSGDAMAVGEVQCHCEVLICYAENCFCPNDRVYVGAKCIFAHPVISEQLLSMGRFTCIEHHTIPGPPSEPWFSNYALCTSDSLVWSSNSSSRHLYSCELLPRVRRFSRSFNEFKVGSTQVTLICSNRTSTTTLLACLFRDPVNYFFISPSPFL